MVIYVSTFISGFHDIIKEILKKYVKNCEILQTLDGLIVYKTSADINRIRQLEFFSNSFILIKEFNSEKEFISSIESLDLNLLANFIKKYQTFKIIFTQENQITPTPTAIIPLEKRIYKELNLKLNIAQAENEFWFSKRREGKCFFMLRLTKSLNTNLKQGEFRSDLAFILNYLAEPSSNDIFMEAFAGYGSISFSRAKNFPPRILIINDIDKKYNGFWNQKLDSFKKLEIIRKNQDTLDFKTERDSSVNKIVADPPWGEYEKIDNLEKFYDKMLKEFERILRKNGILILVTSKKQEFEELLKNYKKLHLLSTYNILINGKKTAVYKIIKQV